MSTRPPLRPLIHQPGRLLDAAGNVDFNLLWAKIQHLERRELDGLGSIGRPSLSPLLDSTGWVQVIGLGRFWLDDQNQERRDLDFPGYTVDLLASLHALQTELLFLLTTTPQMAGLFFGLANGAGSPVAATALVTSALRAVFPTIHLHPQPDPALLVTARQHLNSSVGLLTGPRRWPQ